VTDFSGELLQSFVLLQLSVLSLELVILWLAIFRDRF